MKDESYDRGADRSDGGIPIPSDGLLFKLAVYIASLSVRWFGSVEPDTDPVESPDPVYPFNGYLGFEEGDLTS